MMTDDDASGTGPEEQPDILYHYCSHDTFIRIIESRSVWLSDLTLSNDFMEGKWIRKVAYKMFQEEGLDGDNLQRIMKQLDSHLKFSSAIGFCLSEDGDLLSQWRGYADDGRGVSIGFDRSELERQVREYFKNKADSQCSLVEYTDEGQQKIIRPLVKMVADIIKKEDQGQSSQKVDIDFNGRNMVATVNQALGVTLLTIAAAKFMMKNPAFSEEREWRIYVNIQAKFIGIDIPGFLQDPEFRNDHGCLIPYMAAKFNDGNLLGTIREVVLGPNNRSPDWAVERFLHQKGYEQVTAIKSNAPYQHGLDVSK